MTKQYNQQYDKALQEWSRILFSDSNSVFEFPSITGSIFTFKITSSPAYAQLAIPKAKYQLVIPKQIENFVVNKGILYDEPSLLFSNVSGKTYVRDTHPIRGILNNRPFDYSLTKKGYNTQVRLGVICPQKDELKVSTFLNQLLYTMPANSKAEYLFDFPGFSRAFGLPLEIPKPSDNLWVNYVEPIESGNLNNYGKELSQRIIKSIGSLNSATLPDVILVYVPERWKNYEKFKSNGTEIDLHDFIKAYCVQKGISTQFFREETIRKQYQCEILWWLSLSFYAKSMHTPWILESQDVSTSFLGLGFSIDANYEKGKQIVLGCSHIYNSHGLGLQYKLSKIENPNIRRGNPYMTREDARRLGENTRQLFYQTMTRLPNRVVIHKRTPFLRDEIDGLLEGLEGVDAVDMIEINVEEAFRYISLFTTISSINSELFPVKRGTALVLDQQKALLWVHGTANGIDQSKHYYQGKSRIPAPLSIIRHWGTTGLGKLSAEILGLSKNGLEFI